MYNGDGLGLVMKASLGYSASLWDHDENTGYILKAYLKATRLFIGSNDPVESYKAFNQRKFNPPLGKSSKGKIMSSQP